MGDSSSSTVTFFWRISLMVSMIKFGITVFRTLTRYTLFGRVPSLNSGKYFYTSGHSGLVLALPQIRLVENSDQFGRCSTHLTSLFFRSFFFPQSTSLPKALVI